MSLKKILHVHVYINHTQIHNQDISWTWLCSPRLTWMPQICAHCIYFGQNGCSPGCPLNPAQNRLGDSNPRWRHEWWIFIVKYIVGKVMIYCHSIIFAYIWSQILCMSVKYDAKFLPMTFLAWPVLDCITLTSHPYHVTGLFKICKNQNYMYYIK